jgi:uncharacterized protein (TIGR02246 family)
MRVIVAIAGALALGAGPLQGEPPKEAGPATAPRDVALASREARPQDEKAIRTADEAFTRAYNAGDVKALAALFAQDAEVVDVDGARYQGRDAIGRLFAATFGASPGVRIAVTIDSLRFLGPDAAKEEGLCTITPAGGGAPVSRRYTILFVKQEGRWLQDSVREEPEPSARPHDRLKGLAWMVGDWIDEGSDSVVRSHCRWSEDGNFLLRSLVVKVRGEPVMTISQRIGWDPLGRQIKSWEFDSDGGHGESLWARDGQRWVVKHTGVLPDGRTASATHLIALEKPNRARWMAIDRVADGQVVPDRETYVMVRVPPPPGAQAGEKVAPSPARNTR